VDLTQFHDINPNYTTVKSNINKDKTQDAPIGSVKEVFSFFHLLRNVHS